MIAESSLAYLQALGEDKLRLIQLLNDQYL